MPFDTLIEAIDGFVGDERIRDEVVCQIGRGEYLPRHCEHFRFAPGLDDWMDRASLIIGHGGTGTVLGLLAARKRFIAVANPLAADDHQTQFLTRLGKAVSVLWTRDPTELPTLIERAGTFEVEPLEGMRLADDLRSFLRS